MGVKLEFAIERRVRPGGAILTVAEITIHANRGRLASAEIATIEIDQAVGISLVTPQANRDPRWRSTMMPAGAGNGFRN